MADPNQDQDDLVSQDDIDKLLASTSIEEAEESLEAVDISSDTDDMGELSQDDIDNLMGSRTSGGEPDDFEEPGELSQDDIDSLLTSDSGDTKTGGTEDTEDDMGELSQDDIDSLLGGGPVGLEDDDQENDNRQDKDQEDGDQEIELIDQADIDRLLNPDQDQEPPPKSPETMDAETPAQTQETKAAQADGDGFVIGADQAADAADCLITQKTLDTLMQNAPEIIPASDPVILDDADTVEETENGAPDQVDLDAVDMDTADWEDPVPEPDADDVTQEDIDALLQDPEEEDSDPVEQSVEKDRSEDAEDILISQDDIDTLLMAADQEDEDILGNVLGDDFDDMLEDDFADAELDDKEAEEEARDSDQVVLERSDSADVEASEDKAPVTGRKWYRSRLLLAALCALLVLAIALPAAYFLFYPETAELPAINEQMAMVPDEMAMDALPDPEQVQNIQDMDMGVDSVDMDLTAAIPGKTSGSMALKNFIVLASDRSADMAYITLDISIDYSDRRAYDEINSNLAFFRDVIYGAIQQNLVWEKRDAVTQNDLIRGVEAELKKVLPPQYIESVSFLDFKTS
ncbi:MAG: hypothetical protein V2J08_05725 [Desulfotignum sp.]|jgi:pilus assembly protein FimV|nr:hypothetical protein [Desulfotignum sp.]